MKQQHLLIRSLSRGISCLTRGALTLAIVACFATLGVGTLGLVPAELMARGEAGEEESLNFTDSNILLPIRRMRSRRRSAMHAQAEPARSAMLPVSANPRSLPQIVSLPSTAIHLIGAGINQRC